MKTKSGAPRLVYGVGINDADYVVENRETIEVNGCERRSWFGCALITELGGICYSVATHLNSKRNTQHTKAVVFHRSG